MPSFSVRGRTVQTLMKILLRSQKYYFFLKKKKRALINGHFFRERALIDAIFLIEKSHFFIFGGVDIREFLAVWVLMFYFQPPQALVVISHHFFPSVTTASPFSNFFLHVFILGRPKAGWPRPKVEIIALVYVLQKVWEQSLSNLLQMILGCQKIKVLQFYQECICRRKHGNTPYQNFPKSFPGYYIGFVAESL